MAGAFCIWEAGSFLKNLTKSPALYFEPASLFKKLLSGAGSSDRAFASRIWSRLATSMGLFVSAYPHGVRHKEQVANTRNSFLFII